MDRDIGMRVGDGASTWLYSRGTLRRMLEGKDKLGGVWNMEEGSLDIFVTPSCYVAGG